MAQITINLKFRKTFWGHLIILFAKMKFKKGVQWLRHKTIMRYSAGNKINGKITAHKSLCDLGL